MATPFQLNAHQTIYAENDTAFAPAAQYGIEVITGQSLQFFYNHRVHREKRLIGDFATFCRKLSGEKEVYDQVSGKAAQFKQWN